MVMHRKSGGLDLCRRRFFVCSVTSSDLVFEKRPDTARRNAVGQARQESTYKNDQAALKSQAHLAPTTLDTAQRFQRHLLGGHPAHMIDRHEGLLFEHILRE